MKQPLVDIRSTIKQQHERENNEEELVFENADTTEIQFIVPTYGHVIPDDEKVNSVFYFVALADKNAGTLYIDTTSALPVQSIDGN